MPQLEQLELVKWCMSSLFATADHDFPANMEAAITLSTIFPRLHTLFWECNWKIPMACSTGLHGPCHNLVKLDLKISGAPLDFLGTHTIRVKKERKEGGGERRGREEGEGRVERVKRKANR
jgi:hypothetical protein